MRKRGFCKIRSRDYSITTTIRALILLISLFYVIHTYHSFHILNMFINKNYENHTWNFVIMTNSSQHRIFRTCVHCKSCFFSNAKKSPFDCDDGSMAWWQSSWWEIGMAMDQVWVGYIRTRPKTCTMDTWIPIFVKGCT